MAVAVAAEYLILGVHVEVDATVRRIDVIGIEVENA